MDSAAPSGNFVTDFQPGYNYVQRLEELFRLCARRETNADLLLSAQLSELLHHTAVRLNETADAASLSTRAISYIEHHFHAHLTVEETAQSLYVSPAHLIRTFKKETGYTPHEYMNEYRLMIAAQLLEFGQQRVEEIAAQTGFSSPSHFISCFRKQYGCTPLQYRGMAAFTQKDKDKQY
jgi:AraC-like DNA-binding protein